MSHLTVPLPILHYRLRAWKLRFPHVALIGSVGLAVTCAADCLSRASLGVFPVLYWTGVALIVVPVVVRMAMPEVRLGERLALIVLFGLALYAVKLMRDPFAFTLPDEFPHELNALNIIARHRLYQPNSSLPVTKAFPGLEGATAALAQLTGMSPFGSGILLLAAARTCMMLGLFSLFAYAGGSVRAAALGALVYGADSNFVLWEAQFAYESLALPLLVVLLACVAERAQRPAEDRRFWAIPMLLLICAIVTTHHLTSYVTVLMLLFLGLTRVRKLKLANDSSMLRYGVFALVVVLLWLVAVASITLGYLSPAITAAISSVYHTITGEAGAHALFGKAPGILPVNQLFEQGLGILAVLVSVVAVSVAVRRAWFTGGRDSLKLLLIVSAILYIPAMGARLAPGAWMISIRAVDFLYIGVAFVIGCFPVERLAIRGRLWTAYLISGVAVGVMVVGGVINSWDPASRMSRATEIVADGRKLQSATLTLADWMRRLPPGQVVAPDCLANAILVYGNHPIATGYDLYADTILEASRLQPWMLALWRRHHVKYVVVDLRLDATSQSDAYYFTTDAKGGYPEPLHSTALATKFDQAGLSRIYASGYLYVYALGSE